MSGMPQGEYLQYGGQAIVEGVMMRSARHFAVACRAPNGEIVSQAEPMEKTWIGRQKWLKLPFLRGSWALLDAMALGIKSLRFASNVQLDPVYAKPEDAATQKPVNKKIQDASVAGAMIVGLALGFVLFNFLPNLLAEQTRNAGVRNGTVINLITETVKIIFFLGYIYLISLMPEIKRLFMYHGAEHKAINTMEAGQELTLENCRAQTRLHPRCGTSFAIVVFIVSFILFTFVPRYPLGENNPMIVNVLVRVGLELLILPLIAGISYEAIRIAGKFRDTRLINFLFAPGLATQLITTKEPEDDQIEVAILSLKLVIDAEQAETRTEPVPA